MIDRRNIWVIGPEFVDRYPDGDYTVGRGADPRSSIERAADETPKAAPAKKARKPKPRRRAMRPAAE